MKNDYGLSLDDQLRLNSLDEREFLHSHEYDEEGELFDEY